MFFSKLINLFKTNRFQNKWRSVGDRYYHRGYLDDLRDILNRLTDEEIINAVNEEVQFSTGYATIIEWLDECAKARSEILTNQFKPRTIIKMYDTTVKDYLVYEGRTVSYLSALNATYDELTVLYQAISEVPNKVSREYYNNHLKELFLTGLNFYTLSLGESFDME